MTLLVHTSSDPHALAGTIQSELRRLSPSLPDSEISTLDEQLGQARSEERVAAGLAVCLALSRLYGLLSYSVRQRTREIGIRTSRGAQTDTILKMVLAQGLRLVALRHSSGIAGRFPRSTNAGQPGLWNPAPGSPHFRRSLCTAGGRIPDCMPDSGATRVADRSLRRTSPGMIRKLITW
jgi:hypothetical protein